MTGMAAVYTSVDDEYRALFESVGLVDRSQMGRLRFDGTDTLDLLNRLSTNDLETLQVGQAMHTVLTSNKGRILDLLLIVRLEDHLIVVTSAQCREIVAEHVDFFNFGEDVSIADQTTDTIMLGVSGPKAADVIEAATGTQVSAAEPYGVAPVSIEGVDALAVRTDFLRTPGYEIIAAAEHLESLKSSLLAAGAPQGILPVGAEAYELFRIQQRVPVYSRELSEDRNPHEALLMDHVSLDKGCYIGQEVVLRLHTYEKVQRYLVTLIWDTADAVGQGDSLHADGKEVGEVTSTTSAIEGDRGIGLGYVRKAHVDPGTRLKVNDPDGNTDIEIVETPITP